MTIEQIIKSNQYHIDRIGRRVSYTNSFLERCAMQIRHRVRILREHLTPITVIIDGVENPGHARLGRHDHDGDFKKTLRQLER